MILAALNEPQMAGARLGGVCQIIGVSANDPALETPPGRRRPPLRAAASTGQCAECARGTPGARRHEQCRVRPSLA